MVTPVPYLAAPVTAGQYRTVDRHGLISWAEVASGLRQATKGAGSSATQHLSGRRRIQPGQGASDLETRIQGDSCPLDTGQVHDDRSDLIVGSVDPRP